MKITKGLVKPNLNKARPDVIMKLNEYYVMFYDKTFDNVLEYDIIKLEEEIKNKLRLNKAIDLTNIIGYITIYKEGDSFKYAWGRDSNLPHDRIRDIVGHRRKENVRKIL